MRELEFLPAWYPQSIRRKRLVVLQAWMSLTICVGLSLWLLLASRNVRVAEASVHSVGAALSETEIQLQELRNLEQKKKQLRQQYEISSRMGTHVEASRIFNKLDAAMPPEISLLDLSIQMEDQVNTAASMAAAQAIQDKEQSCDRRMKVKMIGVAPTDVDVMNFLTRLGDVPFFEQVYMTYAKDRPENGHVMREFEVTFCLNLNSARGK